MTSVLQQNNTFEPTSTASQGLKYASRPNILNGDIQNVLSLERPESIHIQSSQAANLQVPSVNSAESDASSQTSYDSKTNSPKVISTPLVVDLEENTNNTPKKVENNHGEEIKIEYAQGLGSRDNYLSSGKVVFKVLDASFDKNVKVDAKTKPYFKFRLGLNSKSTKAATLEGNKLAWNEEIVVKYTNQDSVLIKVKGKGKLIDRSLAKVRVSIIDVVMKGKRREWIPLLKGDDVIGKMHVEMEFKPVTN